MTETTRDFSIKSGERQFATNLEGIRADHRNRYAYGLKHISTPGFGLDLFCGNGYGSWMAFQQGHKVLAIDGSEEAIAVANQSYNGDGVFFSHKLWPFGLPKKQFDFCFCLESVEHVDDGQALVQAVSDSLRPGGVLILSTPNEELMPFVQKQHKFHTRHYTLAETFALIEDGGLELLDWGGQTVYTIHEDGTHKLTNPDAQIERKVPGQFTTVVATLST
jgi:2-polyprenyl-3-methyl-5-hydroxy-6-metoxy-1,4-benzoquinol methylase